MTPSCRRRWAVGLLLLAAAPAAGGPHQYLSKPDDWFAGEVADG